MTTQANSIGTVKLYIHSCEDWRYNTIGKSYYHVNIAGFFDEADKKPTMQMSAYCQPDVS